MASKSKIELILELGDRLFNNKLSLAQKKITSSTEKMQGKLDKLRIPELNTKSLDKLDSLKFGFGAGIGMGVINTITSGVSQLGKEAINSVDALTKFEDTMTFGGFDLATIDTAKTALKKYADDTVYDLKTTANTMAQLAANGVKDYVGLTQAAGNLNAVAGGNADTFKSVALMLTQTAGAGKLTTENWNQMANAIPGASGKLQEALLKNGAFTGNFRQAMEKGMITANEFNQALMDLGNDPIAVEAAKSTKTFEGAIGQMQAGVVDAFSDILQSIGIDNLTGAIDVMSKTIQTALTPFIWFFSELRDGNPLVQALASIIGVLVATLTAYIAIINIVQFVTSTWKAAQLALNVALTANPVGLIIAAIAALIALVVVIIKKWNDWGAALTLFMGPIGTFIAALKSIYDHWDSIKKAFQTDGILGGLKRIGIVLLDSLAKPLQQVLDMASKIPTLGFLATGSNAIQAMRNKLDLITPGEREKEAKKQSESLYENTSTSSKEKSKTTLGDTVSQTVGKANQVKSVIINIDSFIKGGVNMSQNAFQGMNKEEIENYVKEMFMRVVLNAENS